MTPPIYNYADQVIAPDPENPTEDTLLGTITEIFGARKHTRQPSYLVRFEGFLAAQEVQYGQDALKLVASPSRSRGRSVRKELDRESFGL